MTNFFRWLSSPTGIAVCTIGIVQIIVWGTSFYSLGVLAHPIIAETGWSDTLVFAGLTIGLLASSAISTLAGSLIDRAGARIVMTMGTVLLTVTLALVAISSTVWWYLAAWVVVGLAMRLTLYDAAFAAMVQVSPEGGRQAIAFLTLFGGFASTVFWLIGHQLVTTYDWRTTYWIFAGLNLFIAAPLCYVGLARREAATDHQQAASSTASHRPVREPLGGRARTIAMALTPIRPAVRP